MKIHLLILLTFLWSFSAFAESYKLADQVNGGTAEVEIVEPADCASLINRFSLSEASIISDGLGELAKINENDPPTNCLPIVLATWPEPPRPGSYYRESKLSKRMSEIVSKLNCETSLPLGSPELAKQDLTSPSCAGRWVNKQEAETLQAERKKLLSLALIYQKALENLNDIYNEEAKEVAGLRKQAAAKNQTPEKSSALLIAAAALQEKKYEQRRKSRKLKDSIASVILNFSYGVSDWGFDHWEKLQPVAKKLACVTPYPESEAKFVKEWQSLNSYDCGNAFGRYEELAAAKEEFLGAIGDLGDILTQTQIDRNEAEYKIEEERFTHKQQFLPNYKLRRLLTHYSHHLEKTKPADLSAFCDGYYQQQKREKDLVPLRQSNMYIDLEMWNVARELGLSEGEISAMKIYISSSYKEINKAIRVKSYTPEMSATKQLIDSALEKMPEYREPVLRHSDLPPEIAKQHQVNQIVTYDAYTSTTTRLKDWSWAGKFVFLIYPAKGGKDIRVLNQQEGEVLFPAGTKFKVLSRKEDSKKITKIVMQEVSEGKVGEDETTTAAIKWVVTSPPELPKAKTKAKGKKK